MRALPMVLFTTAICFVILFSPQHHTMPCPGAKLGTSSTQEGLAYRTVAGRDMLMTFRDSIATGHTVDAVIGTLGFLICDGVIKDEPALACHQSIAAPTIPDVKPMWTISFYDEESHGVVTELNSEAGSEG